MWRGLLLLVLLWVPAAVWAGAWPREPGGVFVSFGGNIATSAQARRPVYSDPVVYLEYGLSETLTVGLDGYVANGAEEEAVLAFLAWPLRTAEGGAPVSLSLGGGMRRDATRAAVEPVLRLGLSMGRGLDDGWLAADAALIAVPGMDRREAKLDLTWGRRHGDRWITIMQVQSGLGTAGDRYLKLAPSAVFRVTANVAIEAGVVKAITGDRGAGLRLATWWEF